ncbi:MAG TPA: UTP--glucose-1-phosphate uridylyltransferase [Polyangiaceae bacterium]|nr:UTP--glucose-1-phosphate uridylyltransferase [Polyangiaceae bacterium]
MGTPLAEQLKQLPADARETLASYNFDEQRFLRLGAELRDGKHDDGVVHGKIEPPYEGDVVGMPATGSAEYERLKALGEAELAAGRVALVVLAGGMATRMGGVVKALVEALPGKTFLELRLDEIAAVERRYGKAPPFWLMTSDATEEKTRAALDGNLDDDRVATFTQYLSLRLTPKGDIFLDQNGQPSLHAPGHGDLPDALRRSGLLDRFVARGGRTLMMTNLDNMGGTLDAAIIGFHLNHGKPVTSEVVDKLADDRGGIPVRVDGKLRVLEEFRIPKSFDPATVRVFNTNVFHFDAVALRDLKMDWRFYTVKKKVGGQDVIQFERIVNEVTAELPTQYLHVPRTGPEARFLPVKDNDELAQRRPEIEAVARARGFSQ